MRKVRSVLKVRNVRKNQLCPRPYDDSEDLYIDVAIAQCARIDIGTHC